MSDKRGAENKKRRGNTNDKRSRAERNIGWIEEYCRIPEGPDVAKPVVLRPFQRKEIRKIYDNPHRTRLAILSFGRKGLENAAETIVTALRGSAVSVVKDLARSSEADRETALTVIDKLSTSPDFFGPTVRNRLERAVENDNLVDEINKLMAIRSFRRKFDQLQ